MQTNIVPFKPVRPVPKLLRPELGEEGQETIAFVPYSDGTCHITLDINPSYTIKRHCHHFRGRHSDATDYVELFRVQRELWLGSGAVERMGGSVVLRSAFSARRSACRSGAAIARMRLYILAANLARRAGWTIRDDDTTISYTNRVARGLSLLDDPIAESLRGTLYNLTFDMDKAAELAGYMQATRLQLSIRPGAPRATGTTFRRPKMVGIEDSLHFHWLLGLSHQHDILSVGINPILEQRHEA